MWAKAMLLNTELRKLCGALKVLFIDLSDTLEGATSPGWDPLPVSYNAPSRDPTGPSDTPFFRTTEASKEQRQVQSLTSVKVRPKCLLAYPGDASCAPATATSWNGSRDSQYITQGVQRQHLRPPPPDVLDEHGASTDPKHTTMPTKGEPSSADMDTTRGHHPPCNVPMATT
ncbi:hypothetical protein MRX96_003501 [Rhipicephalus microplus]